MKYSMAAIQKMTMSKRKFAYFEAFFSQYVLGLVNILMNFAVWVQAMPSGWVGAKSKSRGQSKINNNGFVFKNPVLAGANIDLLIAAELVF